MQDSPILGQCSIKPLKLSENLGIIPLEYVNKKRESLIQNNIKITLTMLKTHKNAMHKKKTLT